VFGGLPFYFSGVLPQPADFVFESISGFTTTGASVIRDVEVVAPGILFWRSLTHWLGGLGIVVLGLAILPFLGVGGMQLYKAEVPGPVVDKLKPRLKDTAMILWKVYVAFTVAETILLLLGGMNLLDALCHTFGTLATGGFSTKNASIGFCNSVYIDVVVTIFMLLGGSTSPCTSSCSGASPWLCGGTRNSGFLWDFGCFSPSSSPSTASARPMTPLGNPCSTPPSP
jgi:trk system potassium uptake protein TrkH